MNVDGTLTSLGFDAGLADEFSPAPPGTEPARAMEVSRGFVRVRGEDAEWLATFPRGIRRGTERWPQPGPPVTGDWLAVEPDGPVVGILTRRSVLRRHDEVAGDEVLVANAERALVVTSLNQDLNLNRLERLLAICFDGGVEPAIALSKSDLHPDPAREADGVRSALGVEAFAFSSRTGHGLDAIRGRLRPRETTVLVGSSGVGKSTLANTLLGAERQRTLAIRSDDDQGRHATTSRTLLQLPGGALLVDTPGLRSPRPAGPDGLEETFADVFALAAQCRFADCRHEGEPGCEVAEGLADGRLEPRRLESLRKLREELRESEQRAEEAGRRTRGGRARAEGRSRGGTDAG